MTRAERAFIEFINNGEFDESFAKKDLKKWDIDQIKSDLEDLESIIWFDRKREDFIAGFEAGYQAGLQAAAKQDHRATKQA